MEKWLDSNGLADLHRAGFATDRLQRPVELSIDLRVEHALRDELLKAKDKYKAKAASGLVSNVRPARSWRWCRCPISTPIIRARPTIPSASTG